MTRNRWTCLWFDLGSTQVLALLRIFVGLTFLQKLTGFHNFFSSFRWTVRLPRHAFSKTSSYYIDAFRLPVPGFEWLPAPSLQVYRGIEVALLILALCFIVGLFTRMVGPIMAVLWTYLFLLSQFNYSHHVFTFVLVLLVLGFSRCGDHYSLDAYLFGAGRTPPRRPVTSLRMIQVLVSVIYLFGALAKFSGGWMDGGFIEDMYRTNRMNGALAGLAPMMGYAVLGSSTIIIETLLVFGLWVPRLRALSWWLGVALHLGIDTMMGVTTFSTQMMALYIAFIDPVAGRHVVLYDGSCSLCVRCRRAANLFDWFRRFTWLDFRDPAVMAAVTCVTADQLEREMVVIDDTGQPHSGFAGWRAILSRMPLGFMVVWPLYLPPMTWLGERLYRWVAANRYTPVHCGDGACRLDAPDRDGLPEDPWHDTVARANALAQGGQTG
jgi:predicted DCC family thiol-disulfide oxidoreductase YuxK